MAPHQKKDRIAPAGDPAARRVCEGDSLTQDIAELQELDLDGLRLRWRNLFGRAAPAHLPKSLVSRIVAYRMQANVHGDVSRNTRLTLDRLAREAKGEGGSHPTAREHSGDARRLFTGTLLMREWGGVMQRVTVLDDGFLWNSAKYPSLSKVAQAITGTRWNGPRFFGLRAKSSGSRPDAAAVDIACVAAEPTP